MDGRESEPIRAQGTSLSDGPDGRGVVFGGAAYPAGQAGWASAHDEHARRRQRDPLSAGHRPLWRALPKDFPPRTTVFEYLDLWSGTARWRGCITPCSWRCASRPARRRARPPRSSIARVSRARKRGRGSTPRLRRGEESQRKEATHPGRHAGSSPECRGSSSEHPRSRWRPVRAQSRASSVPVHRADLRRWRLSGTDHGRRAGPWPRTWKSSSAPTTQSASRFCQNAGSSSALSPGWSVPTPSKGL